VKKEVTMKTRVGTARALLGVALIATIGVLAACTPEQVAAVQAHYNSDKFRHVLSDSQLLRLRQCESGDRYHITNPTGRYRGAYQFDRPTWNGVAQRHYPNLNGVDPAAASPFDQDKMARALWAERGRQPWPHCGRRV
jgi:hypothetical protein